MRSILIGSVTSSKTMLEEMIKLDYPVNMVFSLDEKYSKNVSGYYPLHELAEKHHLPYRKFKEINHYEHVNTIKNICPDYIFVIGLSQLVNKKIIDIAKKGTVGFHPTPLPKYRGRAAIVWQILMGINKTKCSLFFIDEGIDSGDIIGQEDYTIKKNDYAIDVINKCDEALRKLSKKILPQIINGTLIPVKQNEKEASYLLKRTPEDGAINWYESAKKIQRLIRATSKPYPGAFSNYEGKHKIIFWKADYLNNNNNKYIGIPGQIAQKTDKYLDIVCIDGLLRVNHYENIDNIILREGHRFK